LVFRKIELTYSTPTTRVYTEIFTITQSLSGLVDMVAHRYECQQMTCTITDLSHVEQVGCEAFCQMDSDGDGEVSAVEKEAAFLSCTDGDRG